MRLDGYLEGRSPLRVVTFAAAAVLGLGWVDAATGAELSFSIFYLGPVAAAAWYAGSRPGVGICVVAAVVWLVADRMAGHTYTAAWLPYWNAAVRLGYFLVVTRLLVALRRRLRLERHLADTDALTGLANTRAFLGALEGERDRAARYRHPFTVVYGDLDGFKAVNDRLGHAEGDEVLKRVADALAAAARSTDVVARMGGDEFALLLPETDEAAAEIVVDKIHRAVERVAAERGCRLGVSLGAVTFAEPPADAEAALTLADDRMYEEKRARKTGR